MTSAVPLEVLFTLVTIMSLMLLWSGARDGR
jgi:hypothetical protein